MHAGQEQWLWVDIYTDNYRRPSNVFFNRSLSLSLSRSSFTPGHCGRSPETRDKNKRKPPEARGACWDIRPTLVYRYVAAAMLIATIEGNESGPELADVDDVTR
jgi:hypothetical protein